MNKVMGYIGIVVYLAIEIHDNIFAKECNYKAWCRRNKESK